MDGEHKRWRIFDEIHAERVRQHERFGEEAHPDVDRALTDRVGGCSVMEMAMEYEIPTAGRARFNRNHAGKIGQTTWAHVAVEEMAEAVEAAGEAQQGRAPLATLRAELVQLAAVAVAWIEAIDRRAGR